MRRAFLCLFLIFFLTSGCHKNTPYATETFFMMGTLVEITLPRESAHLSGEVANVMGELSRTLTKDLDNISLSSGFKEVDFNTYRLLYDGLSYRTITNGRFDNTIATITALYGFPDKEKSIPDDLLLKKAKMLMDDADLAFYESDGKYYINGNGLKVDLGAYAKGWIVDVGATFLKKHGVNNFILNAGGDLYACGMKDASSPWRLGIKDPSGVRPYISAVRLINKGLATSGTYERFFITGTGEHISHIFNAVTKQTVDTYTSLSVIAANAEIADVFSTIYYLMDDYEIAELCSKYNTPVFLVKSDGSEQRYCGWEQYEY